MTSFLLLSQLFLKMISFDYFCLDRNHGILSQNSFKTKVGGSAILEPFMDVCDSISVRRTAAVVAVAPKLKIIDVPVMKKRSREEVEAEAFECGAKKGG